MKYTFSPINLPIVKFNLQAPATEHKREKETFFLPYRTQYGTQSSQTLASLQLKVINSIKEKWTLSIPTQVTHPEKTSLEGADPIVSEKEQKASRKRKTVYVASSHTTYIPMEGIYSGSIKLWKQEMTLGPNSLSSDPNNCAGFTRFILALPWGWSLCTKTSYEAYSIVSGSSTPESESGSS